MIKHWSYQVLGQAADGTAWQTSGTVESDAANVWERVMIQTFHALTHGKAIYGKPGVGCKGPYDIKSVRVEQIDGHQR